MIRTLVWIEPIEFAKHSKPIKKMLLMFEFQKRDVLWRCSYEKLALYRPSC